MTDVTVLDRPPSLTTLYARAFRPRRGNAPNALPTAAAERRDVEIDRTHVARYADVCGYGRGDLLPATYLHLLGFPLSIHLMVQDDFPFPLLGMIHLRQRIDVVRPITAEEAVTVRVDLADLRSHRRGAQFDAITTASVDGEVTWRGCSTYLVRGASATGRAPEPAASHGTPDLDGVPVSVDVPSLPTTARWRVPADTGRRYAAVSGDRNPIHLGVLTARPLGFDRPIAHGMWTLARAVAGLEGRVPASTTVDVAYGRPLAMPSTVDYVTRASADGWLVGVRSDREPTRVHLSGTIGPLDDGERR